MKKFFTLELAIEFYQASKGVKLPRHLKDQYLRACSSVALNLAEGSAKPTAKDRAKFYRIALGSHRECQTILKLNGVTDGSVWCKCDFLGAYPQDPDHDLSSPLNELQSSARLRPAGCGTTGE